LLKELKIKFAQIKIVIIFPLLFYFQVHTQLADTISIVPFLLLLICFKKYSDKGNKWYLIQAAFFAFLMYLSKYYNFFVIPMLFGFVAIIELIRSENRKHIVQKYFIFFTAFFIFSSIWIGIVIYPKYKIFKPTTSSNYNWALISPNNNQLSFPGFRVDTLQNLPDKYSYSMWEDPGKLKVSSWNFMKDDATKKYYFKQIKLSAYNYFCWMKIHYVFNLLIILLIFLRIKKRIELDIIDYILLSTLVFYPIGYFLTIIQIRYIFIDYFILFILVIKHYEIIFDKYVSNKFLKAVFWIFIFIEMNKQNISEVRNFATHPYVESVINKYGHMANNIKNMNPISFNFCSISVLNNTNMDSEHLLGMQYVAYQLSGKYYGDIILTNDSVGLDECLKATSKKMSFCIIKNELPIKFEVIKKYKVNAFNDFKCIDLTQIKR
jgi:hypothetical protein